MDHPKLSSTVFSFHTSNRADVRRAFLAHLARFERQFRDVSWQEAPAAFARTDPDDGTDETTTRLFQRAMEELLDSGEICVEPLAGGNRLVRAAA
jgi:hypothetical protein